MYLENPKWSYIIGLDILPGANDSDQNQQKKSGLDRTVKEILPYWVCL